jgi:LacI family transcriptional regulator, galactose operon repressor
VTFQYSLPQCNNAGGKVKLNHGPMKKTKRLTLSDVAREANVSTATVSRLIAGQSGVDSQTRDRVMQAAVRLGFDLERNRKTKIIAFLLSNRGVLHPFHSAVLMGAEAFCAEHDYALLFLPFEYSTTNADEVKVPEILLRRQIVSGVIAAGTNSEALLDVLTQRGVPWVALGNNILGKRHEQPTSAIYFDDVGGAHELTRYLISLGHRQIAFVGNLKLPWYARRHAGYLTAMEDAGLPPQVSELSYREGEEMGYLGGKIVLQNASRPTAILAGDDAAARGVYKAARDMGLNVPEDLSVAGFNDTLEASALHPTLTSVRVFTDELGKQLAEMLLKRIARPDLEAQSITLPTQLVRRESCAQPPSTQATRSGY